MPARPASARDTSITAYRAKRDFARTPEPAPAASAGGPKPSFVVQKHAARRLHWDVRLEHGGVLWSWAVPKGPSLDPADKRLAVHVEDHPLDYAGFHGVIPAGNYGAGAVEIWDEGTWQPLGDPAADLARGEIKFELKGKRLRGRFVLVRMRGKAKETAENWLLIKEQDKHAQPGTDADALEKLPGPKPRRVPDATKPDATKPNAAKPNAVKRAEAASAAGKSAAKKAPALAEPPAIVRAAKPSPAGRAKTGSAPAAGATRGDLPDEQKPQLATLAEKPPDGDEWISEIKFDGYRLMAWKHDKQVRLVTRNGHDWTSRLPDLARAIGRLKQRTLLLDGELVALQSDGLSSFAALQAALQKGGDRSGLFFYLFDLLHLDGWDLRPCRLLDRKAALQGLSEWRGALRYSDHLEGEASRVRRQACAMGLEGIICKLADAPYRAARARDWLKVKCQGRDEFVVLGWTPPEGARRGLGSLHLGFYDDKGRTHYVGGVGTGFTDAELASLSRRLSKLASAPPDALMLAGDPPDPAIRWVRPELVTEVQFTGWSGAGRLRHASYLGLRLDKDGEDVVRAAPDPTAKRQAWTPGKKLSSAVIRASAPVKSGTQRVGQVELTNPGRELWPGITKQDLAAYWSAVAERALPGIAGRPLALVRCPDGIGGQHFFQKHGGKGAPAAIRAGKSAEGPYLAISDVSGLLACAQLAAIELHAWGAAEADTGHPDQIVFDLDPGDGVEFAQVIQAAKDVRERLKTLGLQSFCRTSGGKGLHVVAPLRPAANWAAVRGFCQRFAQAMERDEPARFVATISKAKRRGRILVDWLRNGPGATAVASYSPRARPGAPVATPLTWREVGPALDPQAFTLQTVPMRLAKQRRDPWDGFTRMGQTLPKETA